MNFIIQMVLFVAICAAVLPGSSAVPVDSEVQVEQALSMRDGDVVDKVLVREEMDSKGKNPGKGDGKSTKKPKGKGDGTKKPKQCTDTTTKCNEKCKTASNKTECVRKCTTKCNKDTGSKN